jgi:hypothetical protein
MRTPEPPTEEENWAHGRAVIPAEGDRRSGQGKPRQQPGASSQPGAWYVYQCSGGRRCPTTLVVTLRQPACSTPYRAR